MILPALYIKSTLGMGRGVFTTADIEPGTLLEVAPVIVMSAEEREKLDATLLHDYIFEWGGREKQCCLALGYVSLYNHSYRSNAEYEMDFPEQKISVRAVHFINAGEEVFINYNGNWDDAKPLWFNAK